jgi:hypothetical protein
VVRVSECLEQLVGDEAGKVAEVVVVGGGRSRSGHSDHRVIRLTRALRVLLRATCFRTSIHDNGAHTCTEKRDISRAAGAWICDVRATCVELVTASVTVVIVRAPVDFL